MQLISCSDFPRISIVTPNYNYGHFIEETLDSVLSQGYPNLHYVVIDGGSTDDSVSKIKKYESYLGYWHSKQDSGQADAINTGLQHSEGVIFNWLNSDDVLAPDSLFAIADSYRRSPSSLVAGSVLNIDASGSSEPELIRQSGLDVKSILSGGGVFHQPGLWWNLDNIRKLGLLDVNLDYCFDCLLLLRYLARWPSVTYTDQVLVHFALHPTSKTTTSQLAFDSERLRIFSLLLDDDAFSRHHRYIESQRKLHQWYELVQQISTAADTSRISRFARIASLALMDPALRLSRFSGGALRRLMINQ